MPTRVDLTKGQIPKLLLRLFTPIVFGMITQALYVMVDLYFVGRLGPDAVAAISISGNIFFMIMGLSFIIGTGGMVLIAQSFGRKDFEYASKVFQQSLILTIITGIIACLIGFFTANPYIRFFGGSGVSLQLGVEYFQIFSISFPFLLILFVTGSCYRGMGDAKTPMVIVIMTTFLNIILDPVLIFGPWIFPTMGVQGAAIASLISQACGLTVYFYLIFIKGSHLKFNSPWRINIDIIKKSLTIGLPSGLNFFLLTFNMLITYRVVSPFGTHALASLGIGFRVLQIFYMLVMSLTTAMAAIVGQNYGAGNYQRISGTLWTGWRFSLCIMIPATLLCLGLPGFFIDIFTNDRDVIRFGIIYLTITSLSNILVGTLMTFSSVFQGLGKTYPTFIAAVIDNLLFAVMVFTLPVFFNWGFNSFWWIKISATAVETLIVVIWLKRELLKTRSVLH